jgi:hypothetical protein
MMAPYAVALVLMTTTHLCNPGPTMELVAKPWPIRWFVYGDWVKVDPTEPEYCEAWSVTVKNDKEVIDTFDTMDACKIAQALKDHYINGPLVCERLEPPT